VPYIDAPSYPREHFDVCTTFIPRPDVLTQTMNLCWGAFFIADNILTHQSALDNFYVSS
jgi:hypothetical protein